jgi:GNAT superfamily N-acetyltransferase
MEAGYLNPKDLSGTGRSLPMEICPVHEEDIPLYVATGRVGYSDHYCHLWPGGDPSPYLDRNFTQSIVGKELSDPDLELWLIRHKGVAAGVCKLDLKRECRYRSGTKNLFIEKIYFRNEYTGQGLGSTLISEIIRWGRGRDLEFIWLESMQKGPALDFYLRSGFKVLGETQVPYPEVLESEKKMWVLGLQIKA